MGGVHAPRARCIGLIAALFAECDTVHGGALDVGDGQLDLSTLQHIVDEKALLWNMSFSIGFYTDAIGLQGVAGGLSNRLDPDDVVTTHHRFPVGSVTKPFTAAAILQLHDAGSVASCEVSRELGSSHLNDLHAAGTSTLMIPLVGNPQSVNQPSQVESVFDATVTSALLLIPSCRSRLRRSDPSKIERYNDA